MTFSPYNPVTYSATHLTLVQFLAVTGFLATTMGDIFTVLDSVIIVTSPQMTVLDYFLVVVVMETVWDMWDHLIST